MDVASTTNYLASTKRSRHHRLISRTILPCSEMTVKGLVAFKTKLSAPCRKLLVLLRLKKPLYTRSRGPRPPRASEKPQVCALFPIFRSRRTSKEMNRVRELGSISEAGREKLIPPKPIAPASSTKSVGAGVKTNTLADNVVEEACRSFENYLLEMIVEEGNVRDLMDVEELLYCWKNLKSTVFAELVSRFYGELCKDLSSP